MRETIEKTLKVAASGYVRGDTEVKAYYDANTLELIDYEVVGDIEISRDDTEIEYSEIPKKLK